MRSITKRALLVSIVMILNGCSGGGGGTTDTNTTPTTPTPTTPTTPSTNNSVCNQEPPVLSAQTIQDYLDTINTARGIGQDCGTEGYFAATTPLTWSDALYRAAYEHSCDLATSNTFDHYGSGTQSDITATELGLDFSSPTDRIVNNGYTSYTHIGENITAGTNRDTAQEAIDSWIVSDQHCSALMSPDFQEVGLAHYENATSTYTHYWTQTFGAN